MAKLDEEVDVFVVNGHQWRLQLVESMSAGFYAAVTTLQSHAANLAAWGRSNRARGELLFFQELSASMSLASRYLHHEGEPGERFEGPQPRDTRELTTFELRRLALSMQRISGSLQALSTQMLEGLGHPLSDRSARALDALRAGCGEAAEALRADRDSRWA